MDDPKHFKVVFLGESYVGKTVLIVLLMVILATLVILQLVLLI